MSKAGEFLKSMVVPLLLVLSVCMITDGRSLAGWSALTLAIILQVRDLRTGRDERTEP